MGAEHQGFGQTKHATFRRCHGLQKGYHIGADKGIRCSDPSLGYPKRNQGWLLANWFCQMWKVSMPNLEAQMEDGKGDRREKDGRPSLVEIQRDGPMQFHATTAAGVRYLQEL